MFSECKQASDLARVSLSKAAKRLRQLGRFEAFLDDLVSAAFASKIQFVSSGRTREHDNGDIAKLFADLTPIQQIEATFGAEIEIGDEDIRHREAGAILIHAGTDEVGFGFADVAAERPGATKLGGLERLLQGKSMFPLIFDEQEVAGLLVVRHRVDQGI